MDDLEGGIGSDMERVLNRVYWMRHPAYDAWVAGLEALHPDRVAARGQTFTHTTLLLENGVPRDDIMALFMLTLGQPHT